MPQTKISQMVKQRNTRAREKPFGKGFTLNRPKAGIIKTAEVFLNFLDPNWFISKAMGRKPLFAAKIGFVNEHWKKIFARAKDTEFKIPQAHCSYINQMIKPF